MAETQPKRHREDPQEGPQLLHFEEANPGTKRHKPCNSILSFLDEEEDEVPTGDLSAMFTTLQQELSSSTSCDSAAFDDFDFIPCAEELEKTDVCSPRSGEEDEGAKSVMRHLLEASDDELGIPNREDDNGGVELESGESFPFALSEHGLWELEDEAANYYTVLQSGLFM